MRITLNEESLPIIEALASKTRIQIIKLLSSKQMNIKELAKELKLSNPVTAKHVQILEQTGIIKTIKEPGKAGTQKRSILKVDLIEIDFPQKIYPAYEYTDVSVPIGQYVDFKVERTCGLATATNLIGDYDEPKFFADPSRFDAMILWFSKGFVDYKIMNPLKKNQELKMIDISVELSSEFPAGNNNWPSDITFSINNHEIGTWLSKGDYIDVRGKLNPDWWPPLVNQYGVLVNIRITEFGVWINGKQTQYCDLEDLQLNSGLYDFKIAVNEEAEHVGGCTIYGEKFGNHPTNLDFRFYYAEQTCSPEDNY